MITLEPGDVIKHKRFLDIAIKISHVRNFQGLISVHGFWVNQSFVKSFVIGHLENWVDLKDLNDWQICKEPRAVCIRTTKWEELTA